MKKVLNLRLKEIITVLIKLVFLIFLWNWVKIYRVSRGNSCGKVCFENNFKSSYEIEEIDEITNWYTRNKTMFSNSDWGSNKGVIDELFLWLTENWSTCLCLQSITNPIRNPVIQIKQLA